MFGEKTEEWSKKQNKKLPVYKTAKYAAAYDEAKGLLAKYKTLTEGDFWILMHETAAGDKMSYDGLIIAHTACLKLNDEQPADRRFRPSCMALEKDGYGNSLVYTYCCEDQGIFEVGEVNAKNCTVAYPYAMALKRCFDRVVLKLTKIAYNGVMSDSEADELRSDEENEPLREDLLQECAELDLALEDLAKYLKKTVDKLTNAEVESAVKRKRAFLAKHPEGRRE